MCQNKQAPAILQATENAPKNGPCGNCPVCLRVKMMIFVVHMIMNDDQEMFDDESDSEDE